jgi:cephalosporin-C deacetylase-like acetyl esterase
MTQLTYILFKRNFLAFAFLFLFFHQGLIAQVPKQFLEISVSPEKKDWLYQVGDKVAFQVSVTQSGRPVAVENVRYFVKEEKMQPLQEGALVLKEGKATITSAGMKTPGFLRCEVFATIDGKEYRGLGTAAIEPEKIQPTVKMPEDFVKFWDNAKADLAKIPLEPRMIHQPDRSTDAVDVYHVNFRNVGNSRVYGVLTVPKGGGIFPAILQVPGAGIRPYGGDLAKAARGAIVLQIGIHGIPIDMAPEVYNNLNAGALSGYWNFNIQDKDIYYYKRVYLGCIRAIDFLVSMPQYDGANLAVQGGSQGGALSIVTAALDSRVKYLSAFYPAMSDMTGYLNGRAGGWPHIFSGNGLNFYNFPKAIETVGYYDVVNFARILKTPGFYSWGYNDDTCPPTSYYSAYNQIKAPKEVFVVPETGHWTYPEQGVKSDNWLFEKLKNN